jgi:hypothetical protein
MNLRALVHGIVGSANYTVWRDSLLAVLRQLFRYSRVRTPERWTADELPFDVSEGVFVYLPYEDVV